jgi:hypothetical protein
MKPGDKHISSGERHIHESELLSTLLLKYLEKEGTTSLLTGGALESFCTRLCLDTHLFLQIHLKLYAKK